MEKILPLPYKLNVYNETKLFNIPSAPTLYQFKYRKSKEYRKKSLLNYVVFNFGS